MVMDYSEGKRENLLPPHGLLFPISSKGSFICIIPQAEYHGLCYTSCGWLAWTIDERLTDEQEGRKEMFYLTMLSTHFIYGYMASDIWLGTILIVRKDTHCCHMGYSYRLTARARLYAPSHRQDSTYQGLCYTSRGGLAGTRNSSMGSLHEGSIRRPIAPWANALTMELHLTPLTNRDWQTLSRFLRIACRSFSRLASAFWNCLCFFRSDRGVGFNSSGSDDIKKKKKKKKNIILQYSFRMWQT